MKVSLFEQVPYRYLPEGFGDRHSSVVTAPYDVVDPPLMTESLLAAYAELLHAARAGFDGVCVTEHGQSAYDISPNPDLLASAVAYATLSRMKTATYRELVDSQVAIVGSPATVADQIEAFVREFRIGNLMVMLQ